MSSKSKPNILVVEDDSSTRWLIGHFLECFEAEITFACSSYEGKEILGQYKVDLVVCDYHMAGETGVEVLRYMQAEGKDIPFIFYTSELQKNIPHISYQKFSFVQKPEINELLRAVDRFLKSA